TEQYPSGRGVLDRRQNFALCHLATPAETGAARYRGRCYDFESEPPARRGHQALEHGLARDWRNVVAPAFATEQLGAGRIPSAASVVHTCTGFMLRYFSNAA